MMIYSWFVLVVVCLFAVFFAFAITYDSIKSFWDERDIFVVLILVGIIIGLSNLIYELFPFTVSIGLA